MPDPSRRARLAEQVTDDVLEHGLIGLRLRPLAERLGTSDRMLLHYFANRDDLVATVLQLSNDRSVAALDSLPPAPDVATWVRQLWDTSRQGQLLRCQRLYAEAAALGLFGTEPYASTVRAANERWVAALQRHLEAAGCRPETSRRAADLVDAVLMGLLLDLSLDPDDPAAEQVVADVAVAVAALA